MMYCFYTVGGITSKDKLIYVGEKPWHGGGDSAGEPQTAHAMLDRVFPWLVETTPMYTPLYEVVHADLVGFQVIEGYKAVKRVDTGDILGIVPVWHRPFQNAQVMEILMEQYEGVAKELALEVIGALIAGHAIVKVAGSINAGGQCWMLAQICEEHSSYLGVPYFLLAWGHDGKHGVACRFTAIRVVSSDTLKAALGEYA